jgi:hypothetical protein
VRTTNPEFVIRIIVRARNEIAAVMDRAAKDVDRLTSAEGRHEKQTKNTQKATRDLRREFDEFSASVKRGEKSSDDAVFGLRRLAGEMDKLAKKRPIGDAMGEELNRTSLSARRMIAEINDVERARSKATQQEIADYERFHLSVERGEVSGARAAQGYKRFSSELGALQKRFQAGSDDSLNLGAKMEESRAHANNLGKELRKTRSAADEVHAALGRLFGMDPDRMSRIDDRIESFNQRLSRGRFNVAAFDNRLRGLIYVGVFAFFQQLVGVVGALAGALVELAGSAIQAGSALAGMAAAGVAQVLPMFGLLAAAWGRVGAVFKAAQQATKAATQASYNHTEGLRKQHQATEAVTNAQRALDKARLDARRNLEDLIDAERRAQIQSEAAVLAQENAHRALASAIASGDVGGRRSAEIDVQTADLGVPEAQTAARRATQDASTARRQGIRNNPGVVAARQALEDARANAADTQKQMMATDRTLQQMLAQLDPTERRLYTTIRKIQADFKKVFRPITDIIVGAFDTAVQRVDTVMKDNRVINTARTMAEAIGGQIKRVTSFLTSDRNINFFQRMGQEASRNLPKVITIFENLYKVFRNFATAASPALKTFLTFLERLTGRAATATSEGAGLAKLARFFAQGEHYAEGITKLGIAVGGLILALTGASAGQGMTLLDSITAKINEATTYIREHQGDVRNFFQDAREATGYIATAIWELSKAVFGLFHKDQVKAFADAFTNTLLPTLESVFKVMGVITGVFLKFAGSGPGSALMQFLLTSLLLSKAFSPLVSLFSRLSVVLGTLFGSERLVVGGLTALEVATGPVGIAVAAIAALILVLHDRLEKLPGIFKAIAGGLALVAVYLIGTKGLAGPLKTLMGMFDRMATAGLSGKFGAIGAAFGGILSKVTDLIRKLPGMNKLLRESSVPTPRSTTTGGSTFTYGTRGTPEEGAPRTGAKPKPGTAEWASRYGPEAGAGEAYAGSKIAKGGAGAGLRSVLGRLLGVAGVASIVGAVMPLRQSPVLPSRDHGVLGETGIVGGNLLKNLGNFNIGGAFSNILGGRGDLEKFSKGFQDNFNKLTSQHNVKGLEDLAKKARDLAKDWPQFSDALNKAADMSDKASKHFTDVRKAVAGLGTALSSFRGHGFKADDIADPNAIAQFTSNLSRMRQMGFTSIHDLRSNIAFNLDKINLGFATGSASWAKAMEDNSKRAIRTLQQAMDDGQLSVKSGTKEMQRIARQNLKQLATDMDTLSAQGKEALANNAIGAANAMEKQMKRAGNVTKEGMDRVRDLMTEALVKGYGFTHEQALNIAKTGDLRGGGGNEGGLTKAVGGWIGQQGERGKDKVKTTLGRGEVVLNHWHQRAVNAAMSGRDNLSNIVKRMRGYHAGGPEQLGFAAGGGELFDGHPGNVIPGIRRLIDVMKGRFPLSVTSTTDHSMRTSTGGISDHVSGHAVDLAGSTEAMARAVSYIKSSGIAQRLKQGIHNPGLSINLGKTVPASFWGVAWGQHINHIHLALAGALGEIHGAIQRSLRVGRVGVGGPRSALRAAVQRAIGIARSSANFRLRQAGSATGLDSSAAPTSGGPPEDIAAIAHDKTHRFSFRELEGLWRAAARAVEGGRRFIGQARLMARVAVAESGGKPWIGNAGRTPTGTNVAAGLWQILGLPFQGDPTDPWTNAKMAVFKAVHQGIGSAWAASRGLWGSGLSDAALRKSQGVPYAAGGVVGGQPRQPVQALLHGGEWVLDHLQQSKLGHALGMGKDRLKGWLGFTGGPYSFKGGGEVPQPSQVFGKSTDLFSIPTIYDTSTSGLVAQARRAQAFINKLGTKSKDFLTRFDSAFREMAGDGGIFDQMAQAVTDLTTKLATNLTLSTFKLNKAGDVVQKLDAIGVADRKLRDLHTANAALTGERGAIAKQLDGVTQRIDDLRKGGIGKGERHTYNILVGYKRALTKRINDVRGEIAQNLSDIYQGFEDVLSARADAVNASAGRRTGTLDIMQRGRALLGGTVVTALGGPTNAQLGAVRGNILTGQANQIAALAKRAQAHGHTDTANNLLAQVQDLRMQALEAVGAGVSADVDEVNRVAQRKSTAIDIKNRIATALGKTDVVASLYTDRISATNDQIDKLREQKRIAESRGLGALSEQIQDQINDLDASIVEYTAAQFQAKIQAIDDQASRASTTLGLQNRLADVIQRRGQSVSAAQARTEALRQYSGSLQDQISGYSGLLGEAIQKGNTAAILDLQGKISELQVAIEENTQAIADSITAERQARIDAIANRGNFLTGVFGNLNNLLTALGSITGSLDLGRQGGLLQQIIGTLTQTGGGLRQQLFEAFGVDARGMGPTQLVDFLKALNYDGIEANFSEAQKTQFENLINAIIENATAIESNTDQLNQLNTPTTQQWSSTAWRWFRNAIFTGSGGLLPQYQIPSMDTGGAILSDGYIYGHAGERVVAANIERDGGGGVGTFAPSFAVTEQVEEADVDVLSNRMLWAWRNRPRGRG